MKTVAIIQARMGSTRFPGKVLKRVAGRPLLAHSINCLRVCKLIDEIVVATSMAEEDQRIVEFAAAQGIRCFVGSEEDVMQRYLGAALWSEADFIVRVPGDDPIVSASHIDLIVDSILGEKVDYVTTKGLPLGAGHEVFTIDALKKSHRLGQSQRYREHVSLFIKEHPSIFFLRCLEIEPEFRRPDIRLTVDTYEDLCFIEELLGRIPQWNAGDIREVLSVIDQEPRLLYINYNIVQKAA